MGSFFSRIRVPVKRGGAEHYLLLTLLSFAASVVLIRLYLEVTGYPRLAYGPLYIAHVLWGGLLLYVASLLPLVLANRAVYTLGAILSGVGAGLFVDEVGKFITRTNDYFHPAAVPIIYAFFLLTVLLYLRVRRPPSQDPRAELYRALDGITEVLDHDLEPRERHDLEAGLKRVAAQLEQPELARLANALLTFLSSESLALALARPRFWDRWGRRAVALEHRHLGRGRFRLLLMAGVAGLGFPAVLSLVSAIAPESVPWWSSLGGDPSAPWLRLALTAAAAAPMAVAFFWLLLRRDRLGIAFAYFGLVFYLTVVNLMLFYLDQLQAISGAFVQFILLLLVLHYRRRYLGG